MKNIAITLIALISILISPNIKTLAQGNGRIVRENRSHRNFSGIKVGGSFDVFIQQGNTERVTIEADENLMDQIETKVEQGVLVIRTRKGIENASKLNVFVTIESLDFLKVSGAADLVAEDHIRVRDLEIQSSGSSDIKLMNLNAEKINCSSTGSSDIKLVGRADTINGNFSGSSDLKASELRAKHCKLRLSGSSDAKVYVAISIDAVTSGSSDIYCSGNPERRRVTSSGSSDIHFLR